ncbi:GGDEF domain-containing protein [Sandarakinorhabdus sp.]|uniref:GGDEF domain-containing protein n=1 Tax=Sandarakinorhabdus sp. TaxID=1916663 RepID=UPI00286D76DE|nr:GGDEF domain-containing protein [Sandarakinorhabdus sp.]
MQHQPGPMLASQEVAAPADLGRAFPTGSGPMVWFDQIRNLLVRALLPPEPPVYELLWRYVRDEDHELSLAVDRAMAENALTPETIAALRHKYMGQLSQGDVSALVAAAQGQADALTRRIADGQTDLADYGRAIADGGERLAATLDSQGLAALLEQLGAATSAMQAANARLLTELETAATEARALSEKLTSAERAAITDVLTGVLNRRGTIAAIEKAQVESRANAVPCAVSVVDIDHFKRFNDRFGHAMGDDVLVFVARHLADRVEPQGGTVGRLGGEEFVAIFPGLGALPATGRIDRIRAELAGQVLRSAVDGSSMGRISFSAGVAQDRPSDNADRLLERADQALYTAKRMGRDRVVPDRS